MQHYAKKIAALAALDEPRALAATESLIANLKARGEQKALARIARDLRRRLARRKALTARVEVARASDAPAALRAAKEAGIDAKTADVNPSLVSGWRARANGLLVDRSGKRALIELYRNITG